VVELHLEVSIEGAVAWVVFEREGVLNALAPADLPRLAAAIRKAGDDEGVRVVVVRGTGGAFSSGDDIRATADLTPEEWRGVAEGFHDLTRVARGLKQPVIAAIDGVCIGGMFEFACSCDLRVATTRSRFACPEVGIGLVVSNAATVLLPQLCGTTYASELMLTGRLIDATEARENGLLNRIVAPAELDDVAREVARDIAQQAPLAVAATKSLLVDAQQRAVEEAMARETKALVGLVDTADMREGFAAFREKRAPSFSDA
jgi:enoyl-CoA hydratase